MNDIEIEKRIKMDELNSEKLINKFRFSLGLIFITSILAISVIRSIDGFGFFPLRAYSFTGLFFIYSIFLIFYLNKKTEIHPSFKFICVILDMMLISAAIWMGCTYLEEAPPLPFLSIQALFYIVLILAGAFRYSVSCAYFSGIFSAICYFLVVFINRDVLDLPYFFIIEDKTINISFPIYNEAFRTLGMLVSGIITGMACKRNINLTKDIIESKTTAAQNSADTVIKIFNMSKVINKSTDDIFHSSKNIFATANNQAASIQEIEATVNENAQIANDISGKTQEVAKTALKMEDDVKHGFQTLKQNIEQLDDIKKENNAVITGIEELGTKLIKIRDFILSIEDITDQTKVIAFNASLEAASAGEYGKRFSVVANEVNRLADNISNLTKQIKKQANELQTSSTSLVVSGKNSTEKINLGNDLIKILEDIFFKIRDAAEITSIQAQTISVSTLKQQKSIEQIKIAISDITKGLSSFLDSTKIANKSAEELTAMIQKLDILLKKTTDDNI